MPLPCIRMDGMKRMKCRNCGVEVVGKDGTCPLCARKIEMEQSVDVSYPQYERTPPSKVKTLFFYLTIVSIVICVTINFLTFGIQPYLWSVVVAVCFLYIWLLITQVIASRAHKGRKLLIHYWAASILLVVIDLCNGFSRWSVNFVIPFLTIASSLLVTITVLQRGKFMWNEYIGYFFAMLLISLIPILLFAFGVATVLWTCLSSTIYAGVILVGMLMFRKPVFWQEVKNRFRS